jgi:ribonuclease HI
VLVRPDGTVHVIATRLEYGCTSNQMEYEALASGLAVLVDMGIRNVEAFRDSDVVV